MEMHFFLLWCSSSCTISYLRVLISSLASLICLTFLRSAKYILVHPLPWIPTYLQSCRRTRSRQGASCTASSDWLLVFWTQMRPLCTQWSLTNRSTWERTNNDIIVSSWQWHTVVVIQKAKKNNRVATLVSDTNPSCNGMNQLADLQ